MPFLFSSKKKKNGLKNVLLNLNQFFIEDMLMVFLFYSNQLIISKNFITTLILITRICPFSFEEEKNGKMSFLDVEISQENGKFVTTVYRKSTFSGVYTHFESFLPSTYKFDMLYTLVYRCFTLCSDWSEFHKVLVTLKEIFQRNGYPKSFIDKCYKKFLDRLHITKPTSANIGKEGFTVSVTLCGADFFTSQNQNKKCYEKHFKLL